MPDAACKHTRELSEWVPCEDPDWWSHGSGEWRVWSESTFADDGPGRFRCTQCGEVGYYTGLWRQHYEGGRVLLDERTGIQR